MLFGSGRMVPGWTPATPLRQPSLSRAPRGAPPAGTAAVGVVYAVVRAAAFAAFELLVGSVAFVLLCWPGAIARRDVRRVMLVGWAGLLVATVAALLLQGPYGYGLGPGWAGK